MIFWMCLGLCNGAPYLEIMKRMVTSAAYVICLPITAILLTGANLILGDDNVVAKKLGDLEFHITMDNVTLLKLFEILGSIWAKSILYFLYLLIGQLLPIQSSR